MRTVRVLVVDDEPGIRDSLSGVLEDEGFSPDAVASGEECLTALQRQPYELVLLDIWLPGMDGLGTLERIQEIPPDVDLLIMQHHELPDGTGFPRHLSAKQISPLGALFIVAHELVHYIYEKGPEFQMKDFLEANIDRYNTGHYKKILACLLKTKT